MCAELVRSGLIARWFSVADGGARVDYAGGGDGDRAVAGEDAGARVQDGGGADGDGVGAGDGAGGVDYGGGGDGGGGFGEGGGGAGAWGGHALGVELVGWWRMG